MNTYALDTSHSADGNVLVPNPPLRKLNDVLLGDSTNHTLNLSRVHSPSGGDDLSSNVLSNSSGSVQAQKQRRLELGLGTLNLGLSHGLGHAVPLTEGEVDQVVNVLEVVGDHVRSPQTDIRVRGAEAHEGVGKVVLVQDSRQLAAQVGGVAHGTVVVSNDGLGDKGGEVVRVLPANTLNGNSDVGGGDGVVTHADLRADEVGLLGVGGAEGQRAAGRLEAGEVLLGQLDELLVGDSSSTDKDHAVSLVVGRDVVLKVLLLDRQDVLPGAKDGAAEGLALERGSVQVVEDNLLELLVDLLLLPKDDVALALNGGLLELGVLKDIGKDLNRLSDVILERLGVVDRVLALDTPLMLLKIVCRDQTKYRSVGVQVTTHVLNLQLQLLLGALVGALCTNAG
jgi:hypothetical protein